MIRIFFSAGESSGDMHGANLIRALRVSEVLMAAWASLTTGGACQ